MKIYVVDSDEGTRSMLLYVLGEQSYTASGFETADSFKAALRTELPNLILLDSVMTEKEDGLSLLKWLKADRRTASIPVILLMEKATEMDRVIGLDLGADDYLSKPFGILELLSRMHAILRRTEQPAQREQEPRRVCQDLIVYPERHFVTLHGKELHLTKKEFRLLWYLLENRGNVMTRERIMEYVWDADFDVETRTIDIHINTLRKKLKDNGAMIQTIRGVGYKIS
ncbi:MAG: response regulator transcription factor [Butyricicoccus sp.]|nr:response regulator transcription factor [Clostridiales bacterium]MDD7625850.1 response regulator transcription factor [Butyricicoccus sp.]MDY4087479.1 response regulator transcription factor [Butyricicoccus intestinisimiae]